MLLFLTAALILQLILFHLDEYYFHRKRGLSRPEIVSALMDGFFYLLPLAIAIFCSFTIFWQWIYIFLAILSCLSVVKNEWFYPVVMDRNEKLVHAGLYLLHPILLYTFYLSWDQDFFNNSM
ncbi:MAG: hypothetical protein KDD50_03635, partial [Bdellovibrionales bacterium]|nr:hypothetical protein [Bdellovibrionales bacterium]